MVGGSLGVNPTIQKEEPMKKVAILLCAALAVGLVFAAGMEKGTEKAMGKTHKMTVEVVSVDMDAKTITIKDEKGETKAGVPVMGKALDELKMVKPGEKIVVTCQDNEKGEHTGITKIQMAKAHSATAGK
jgi:hypothetical protein